MSDKITPISYGGLQERILACFETLDGRFFLGYLSGLHVREYSTGVLHSTLKIKGYQYIFAESGAAIGISATAPIIELSK